MLVIVRCLHVARLAGYSYGGYVRIPDVTSCHLELHSAPRNDAPFRRPIWSHVYRRCSFYE